MMMIGWIVEGEEMGSQAPERSMERSGFEYKAIKTWPARISVHFSGQSSLPASSLY